MASATGIPERTPAQTNARSEEEPLLGRPGDATQTPEQGLQFNFITGTAVLAQAGIWILTALVWAAIFQEDLMFFSLHPLLQSAGILLLTQAILVLQPTSTQKQKRDGTWVHAALNTIGAIALVAGFTVIEINKADHPATRFQSIHGKVGLAVFILVVLQVIVGIVQYWIPSIVGGVENGKALYKYHRMSGYLILVLSLVTICLVTTTGFNINVLHMKLWAIIVASILVVIGIAPRIKKQKLGF